MNKALALGILASLFFAVTFVLNRQMLVGGGHWIWSSSLRFYYMAPLLFLLMLPRRRYRAVFSEIRRNPRAWFLWSIVGFGIFYSCITMAASYGPSWLIASTWQVTIVAGALLTPLFYHKADPGTSAGTVGVARVRHTLPVKQLVVSVFILTGIVLVQVQDAAMVPNAAILAASVAVPPVRALAGMALVLVAAFAYPLGNRKMMELVPPDFGTMERVFGMTLCSLPFWLILSAIGLALGDRPTAGQFVQTFVVAVFSGVIATILFFKATELVQDDVRELAVVESTQAGEVVFALLGGALVFKDRLPSPVALAGIFVVIAGMVLNAVLTKKTDQPAWAP